MQCGSAQSSQVRLRTHMSGTQNEAWPPVTGLSPVRGGLPPPAPICTTAQAVLSCLCSEKLACAWLGAGVWVRYWGHRSQRSDDGDDDIKPASSHSPPVLHMLFLLFTACFKRCNTLAACPCF